MCKMQLSESQKKKIIAAVINSDKVIEVIHKLSTAIAPAIEALLQVIQQAIKEELSKATEDSNND